MSPFKYCNSLTLSLLMTLEASRSINRYSRRPHRRNTLTALRTLSSLLHPEGDKWALKEIKLAFSYSSGFLWAGGPNTHLGYVAFYTQRVSAEYPKKVTYRIRAQQPGIISLTENTTRSQVHKHLHSKSNKTVLRNLHSPDFHLLVVTFLFSFTSSLHQTTEHQI